MDYFITFSAPMIRAILEGRKTQTRLVAMQQPAGRLQGILTDTNEAMFGESDLIRNCDLAPLKYRAGDRLWVREAHYLTDDGESEYPVFAADQGDVDEHLANMQTTMASWPDIDWSKHLRLRPSIHMPRWASRLTLVVDDVRVQRLQDISEADAIAEGCPGFVSHDGEYGEPPREDFHDLWNSIHGPDAWVANPWVVALTFTPNHTNIDQMGGE